MAYVLLGLVLVALLAGTWLWWTGARRDRNVSPAAGIPVEPPRDAELAPGAGSMLLLCDNFWEECVVDGTKEDWRRHCARGARGFYGVPSGRHQIVTTCAEGAAVLDFVLYPGEVFVRRLDHGTATWQPEPPEAAEKHRAVARDGLGGTLAGALIAYRIVLGVARAMRGEPIRSPDAAYGTAMASLDRLLERARKEEPAGPLLEEAYAVGRALIGAPLTLTQLRALTSAVGVAVSLERMGRTFRRGALMASIGLAMLPDDPYLLEQLATVLCDGGVPDEAEVAIEKALERADALDVDALARARATKAEVLVRLGRADEARRIIDPLVAARPADTNAVRVKGLVYEKIAN